MKVPQEFKNLGKRDLIRVILNQQLEINNLKIEIDELKRRLAAYENAHTPSSKNKRHYPKREPTGNPVGAPKGHPGTTRPTPTPDKVVEVTQERCSICKHALGKPIKILKRVIEDIPEPQPITVTQYNVHAYLCKNCAEVNIPSHPDLPADGRFGKNLMAQAVLKKYDDRLPLEKVASSLQREYGIIITPATVLNILERVTCSCEPIYNNIRQQIKHASNVYADETGQRVQGRQWWTWIFTTQLAALFLIRKSRGQKPVEEVLGRNYEGVLNCDGLSSYQKVVKKIQRCWAHLLREAKWLAEIHEGQARNLYNGIMELFAAIKHVRKNASVNSRKKIYTARLKKLQYWINVSKAYKELRKFASKIERGLEYWFTCVLYPGVEPTNNRAERGLREMVVQRKITGTLRNERGTHVAEVLMSCIQTWKLQGLSTFTMLRQSLS